MKNISIDIQEVCNFENGTISDSGNVIFLFWSERTLIDFNRSIADIFLHKTNYKVILWAFWCPYFLQ